MKRFTTIILAAALVFAVAATASAAALETSGELRARGWYLNSYFADGKITEFWDQRLRLNMDWAVAENVKLHARADINEGVWGSSATITNDGGGVPNIKNAQIAFDHVNMVFLWPGTPLTFTIGRQDVSWGTGYDTQADNRDRFKVSTKFGDVAVALAYDKNAEVMLDHATKSDNRAWSVGIVIPAGPAFKVGLLGGYLINGTRSSSTIVDQKYFKGNAWVTGKAGIVDVKAEGTYITGDSGKMVGADKQKLTGLGAYAGVFAPAGPVTIGLEGAYAAGDKASTLDENEGAFRSDYQGPFWSVIFYQNMDYPGLGADGRTSTAADDFQVTNALAGKLSLTAKPMPKLTVIANALLVSCDQAVGTASKALGTELDLVLVYGITDNVSVTAGVGYAMLGNYWLGKLGAPATEKPENPVGSVVSFNLKF